MNLLLSLFILFMLTDFNLTSIIGFYTLILPEYIGEIIPFIKGYFKKISIRIMEYILSKIVPTHTPKGQEQARSPSLQIEKVYKEYSYREGENKSYNYYIIIGLFLITGSIVFYNWDSINPIISAPIIMTTYHAASDFVYSMWSKLIGGDGPQEPDLPPRMDDLDILLDDNRTRHDNSPSPLSSPSDSVTPRATHTTLPTPFNPTREEEVSSSVLNSNIPSTSTSHMRDESSTFPRVVLSSRLDDKLGQIRDIFLHRFPTSPINEDDVELPNIFRDDSSSTSSTSSNETVRPSTSPSTSHSYPPYSSSPVKEGLDPLSTSSPSTTGYPIVDVPKRRSKLDDYVWGNKDIK
jgi:hypothetical protein